MPPARDLRGEAVDDVVRQERRDLRADGMLPHLEFTQIVDVRCSTAFKKCGDGGVVSPSRVGCRFKDEMQGAEVRDDGRKGLCGLLPGAGVEASEAELLETGGGVQMCEDGARFADAQEVQRGEGVLLGNGPDFLEGEGAQVRAVQGKGVQYGGRRDWAE